MYDATAVRTIKITLLTIITIGVFLVLPTKIVAQVCGDVDGNGMIQFEDMFTLIGIYCDGDTTNCRGDVDGNVGLSLRDVVFLYEFAFNPPGWPMTCCPAPGAAIIPSTDPGTYLFPSTNIIPADSSGAWVSIGLSSSYELRALFARLRLQVGDDAVQISNIQYTMPTFAVQHFNGDPLSVADTLTLAMGVYYSTSALPANSYELVTFYISLPAADTARTITYEMITDIRPPELVCAGEDNLPILEPSLQFPDLDGDRWSDYFDNCPYTPNADQADIDDNGIGDVCTDSCTYQMIGNVNNDPDGNVDIADLSYLSLWMAGNVVGAPPPILSNADVDGDCDIDEHDFLRLLERLYDSQTQFVECTCQPENIETFCCKGSAGNANGDPEDAVNIADVTYLTKYLFGIPNGPMPPCWEEADVNGSPDYAINISDVTYLVAYLFGDPAGDPPVPCPYDL